MGCQSTSEKGRRKLAEQNNKQIIINGGKAWMIDPIKKKKKKQRWISEYNGVKASDHRSDGGGKSGTLI